MATKKEADRQKHEPSKQREKPAPSLSIAPLTGYLAQSDPFRFALSKMAHPGGLLGKVPPKSWARVEGEIGKPLSDLGESQIRQSLELLGYWVDSLTEAIEWERMIAALKTAPRKRGRPLKPKPANKSAFPAGLLSGGLLSAHLLASPNQPRNGGRPKKWSDESKIELANFLDVLRARFRLRSYTAAVEKLLELMAKQKGKTVRGLVPRGRTLTEVKGALINGAARGRKLRSKPAK